MSKRNINQVSNPVQNNNEKKMKTENTFVSRPATKEEVDVLMTSLRKGADEVKKNKSRNLNTFQREIDEMIQEFRDDIQTLSDSHFTRHDWKTKKIDMIYLIKNRDLINYLYAYLRDNKYLSGDFKLKNTSKIIQELLWASQTPLGKLFCEYHPKFRIAIENKIKEMSVSNLSEFAESIKEVKELRYYANKISV